MHSYEEKKVNGKNEIYFKGISIVNGAQTIGAIGNLDGPPSNKAMVQVRFIVCSDAETVYDIVRYNNSQNKITAPDFRSNDQIQRRLLGQFEHIPGIVYMPRRGGHEDIIKRRSDTLPSVAAGQALAAFHGDPDIAYHEKTRMWEDDSMYSKYFNDQTTAHHVLFAYSLLKCVEEKKTSLLNKSKENTLKAMEKEPLGFFRRRGSTFLMTSAIGHCLEIILDKAIPNTFSLRFTGNPSASEAVSKWSSIVEITSAFTSPLVEGLADGFKAREAVERSTSTFQSLVAATKEANSPIFTKFAASVA